MKYRTHDESMIERFQANPDDAARLVNSIIEDGDDQGELKIILQLIAAAGIKLSVTPMAKKPRRRAATKQTVVKRPIRTARQPATKKRAPAAGCE
jgi:DNA-binding phage protein